MTNPEPGVAAAHLLLGLELPGGWRVVKKLERAPDATGSNFSVGYIVEREGAQAYLKALDYSHAFSQGNVARVLQAMTSAFNFEVDVLERCKGMNRIVRALDHGEIEVEGADLVPNVSYLIFELAEGDVRAALDRIGAAFDYSFALRVLHHSTAALAQLHGGDIAHQDVKPSNVLTFKRGPSKLADLGRAAHQNLNAPHDEHDCAGDPAYAPPELLYGEVAPDWRMRRQACDLYLLGSLAMFLFSGATMTAELVQHMSADHHYDRWGGTYRELLPFVRLAFDTAIDEFEDVLPLTLAPRLTAAVRQLCDPDPALRGHPRARAMRQGNPYALERFVAEFNLLASRAETGSFRDAA